MDLGESFKPSPGDYLRGLEAFAWRRRMVTLNGKAHEQFLVMNDGSNSLVPASYPVIGSGFTIASAASSASARLKRAGLPPEHFSPLLRGYRFGETVESGSNFVTHQVLDDSGAVLGAHVDGKDAACREAEITLLARKHISDLTYAEFRAIAFPVEVQPGRGRGDAATLYAGEEYHLRRMLQVVFDRSPSARRGGESRPDFVNRVRADIAKSCKIGSEALYSGTVDLPEVQGRVFMVMHTGRLSADEALESVYRLEQESAQEQPRERMRA